MRLLLLLLPMLLFWGLSCDPEDPLPGPTLPPVAPPAMAVDTFSYLALGDSYTFGQGVDPGERYPAQLADTLVVKYGILLQPLDMVARTGWTTTDLQDGLAERTDLQSSYDLVTLLIGVNNFYRGHSLAAYEVEFADLLAQSIDLAGGDPGRVCVLSIPDYAYTPFGGGSPSTSRGIERFNASNRRITDSVGVAYVDVTSISRQGLDEPALVSDDQLHPSGLQYARWVEVLAPVVVDLLK
ncbi:MAG: SGNH/GDSL hydrolase family protein [Bacteroidetes bacterium]|nr:MAG: SGNH/GDSL hydrolase family protein [Bacteroidota bacterium]